MLTALQEAKLHNRVHGYEGERETTRFMRKLHFTNMGECVHLRSSLPMWCWDHGYEVGYRPSVCDAAHTYSLNLAMRAASRFGMRKECQTEYLRGVRAGRADREAR